MKHTQKEKSLKLIHVSLFALASAAFGCVDVGALDEEELAQEDAIDETSAALSTTIAPSNIQAIDLSLDPGVLTPGPSYTSGQQGSSGGVGVITCSDGADNCHACGGGWVASECKTRNWYGACTEMTQAFCNYAH